MIKQHFKFVGDFVHTAANRLGIPLIVLTKGGEATLATFTVGDEGITAGYILPPVINEVTIKGTFSIDDTVKDQYVTEEYSLVQSTNSMFDGIHMPDGRDYLLVRTTDRNSNVFSTLYKWGSKKIVRISTNCELDYSRLAIDSIIRLKEVYHETCISDQI